jgi:hypothetical protein
MRQVSAREGITQISTLSLNSKAIMDRRGSATTITGNMRRSPAIGELMIKIQGSTSMILNLNAGEKRCTAITNRYMITFNISRPLITFQPKITRTTTTKTICMKIKACIRREERAMGNQKMKSKIRSWIKSNCPNSNNRPRLPRSTLCSHR